MSSPASQFKNIHSLLLSLLSVMRSIPFVSFKIYTQELYLWSTGLRLHASTAWSMGSTSGQGTKILHAINVLKIKIYTQKNLFYKGGVEF